MLGRLLPTAHQTEELIKIVLPLLQKNRTQPSTPSATEEVPAVLKEVLAFLQQQLTQPKTEGENRNFALLVKIVQETQKVLVKVEEKKAKIEKLTHALKQEKKAWEELYRKDQIVRQFEEVQTSDIEGQAEALMSQLELEKKYGGTHGGGSLASSIIT
jgi:hypothetical protein